MSGVTSETDAASLPGVVTPQPTAKRKSTRKKTAEKPAVKAKPVSVTSDTRLVVPMFNDVNGYCTNRVDVTGITATERHALKRLWTGLDASGATLIDGQPVDRPSRAFRWILQQLSAE